MRSHSWALLLALGMGLAIGLYYAWVISPASARDVSPATLRADFKEQVRVAIASAYVATGNLDRARVRLGLLGDTNPVNELAAQAQQVLAAGQSVQVAQDLARLAADLNSPALGLAQVTSSTGPPPSPALAPTQAPAVPSLSPAAASAAPVAPTAAAFAASIPPPSQTPVPTPNAPFILLSTDTVCNPNLTARLLQIVVLDKERQPMPGVEIAITWDMGEEHVFTGLKPEVSSGYADFVMQAGTTYAVLVARSGSPISGIASPTCPQSGNQTYLGGLKLTFRQP